MDKSSSGAKTRTRKPRSEHRYVPRFTNQEIKPISRGSNLQVTPLFEKVLTVSDAGKNGRLVLPKKYAEVHFPTINLPQGKDLTFKDVEGTDWKFNFRYWPNNNSRMYVLEGFNRYVTEKNLKAGDTVMFSRLKSKGNLFVGHRNGASASTSSHVGLFRKPKTPSPSNRKDERENMLSRSSSNRVSKGNTISAVHSTFSQEKQKSLVDVSSEVVGPNASILAKRKHSEMDMVKGTATNGGLNYATNTDIPSAVSHEDPNVPINVHTEVVKMKSSIGSTRNNREMGMLTGSSSKKAPRVMAILGLRSAVSQKNDAKNDHSKVVTPKVPLRRNKKKREFGLTNKVPDDDESKKDNLTLDFQGGQELIQPHPGGNPPSKMMFEGVKLKSYKDDPVIGRPCMFAKHDKNSVQWGQCAKCYKWRKLPIEVEIPTNWTCKENHWDLKSSHCSAKEELTLEMIRNIFPTNNHGSSKKIKTGNMDPERVETVEGWDEVAVTLKEKTVALPERPNVNKKHPRHPPGCTCIVCMQAPSRSKHKLSCESYRSATARRQYRPKNHSKIARSKLENTKSSTSNSDMQKVITQPENVSKLPEIGTSSLSHQMVVNGGTEVNQNTKSLSDSAETNKIRFDLNFLPEPDEDDMDIVVTVTNRPSGGYI